MVTVRHVACSLINLVIEMRGKAEKFQASPDVLRTFTDRYLPDDIITSSDLLGASRDIIFWLELAALHTLQETLLNMRCG